MKIALEAASGFWDDAMELMGSGVIEEQGNNVIEEQGNNAIEEKGNRAIEEKDNTTTKHTDSKTLKHNNTSTPATTKDVDACLAEIKDRRSNMVSYLRSLLSQLRESTPILFLSRSSVHRHLHSLFHPLQTRRRRTGRGIAIAFHGHEQAVPARNLSRCPSEHTTKQLLPPPCFQQHDNGSDRSSRDDRIG